jgi:hypothetical protein
VSKPNRIDLFRLPKSVEIDFDPSKEHQKELAEVCEKLGKGRCSPKSPSACGPMIVPISSSPATAGQSDPSAQWWCANQDYHR